MEGRQAVTRQSLHPFCQLAINAMMIGILKNVSVRPLYLFKVGCVSRSEFLYTLYQFS